MNSLRAEFATPQAFLTAFDTELLRGGLLVRGSSVGQAVAMSECAVEFHVAGNLPVSVPGRIAAVVPGLGVAVMFDGVPPVLRALADQLRTHAAPTVPEAPAPAEGAVPEARSEGPPGPLSERLKALTVPQKMSLALSADRETRFALLRDSNKMLHVFVLKNPRVGLDEVQAAAKLASLSPDALKFIAEHREWGTNAAVCTALVRNPKTPLPLALRLLDRVPAGEIRSMAKGGARDQIVAQCRKRVSS